MFNRLLWVLLLGSGLYAGAPVVELPVSSPVVAEDDINRSIADVWIDDSDSDDQNVTLTVTNGVVSLNGIAGLSFSVGDGSDDSLMTFSGELSNINNALDSLKFSPTSNFDGTATLQIQTSDGSASDDKTLNITVNNAPEVLGITRLDSNPAGTGDLRFQVSFSEMVYNVFPTDFNLSTTGSVAGTIASVSAATGTNITVVVNSISGEGTLKLNLLDDDSTESSNGVKLGGSGVSGAGDGSFTTGEHYDIDTIPPTVLSVSVPSDRTHMLNEDLNFTITTSENVEVNTTGGTPRLAIRIGSSYKYANYVSGSGTSALLFRYVVEANLLDEDGIELKFIDLNNGTLKDIAGNTLNMTLNNVAPTNNVWVDTTPPVLSRLSSSDINQTSSTIKARSNEDGTLYYVLSTSSVSPSAEQVMRAEDENNNSAIKSGNSVVSANITQSFILTDLKPETTYYYYFVAKDNFKNVGAVSGRSFTTDPYEIAIAKLSDGAENNSGVPTNAQFQITISPTNISASSITGDINYSGTATQSLDYALGVASFTINDNENNTTITLNVIEDNIYEGNESIIATISNSSKGVITTASATATLIDDDPKPTLSVQDINRSEGNSSAQNITLSVAISHPASTDISVNYASADESARSSEDYVSASGALTFLANSVSEQNISLTINGDYIVEDNESFLLNFSNLSTNAQMSDTQARVGILNDDVAGFVVTQTSGETIVSENGTTDSFSIVLTSQPTANVVLSLVRDIATKASLSPTTLTFTPSDWNISHNVVVTGLDDGAVADGDQNTTVTISVDSASSDGNYSAVASQSLKVKTVDNDIPGITVSPTALTLYEPHGAQVFSVWLNTQPLGGADVNISAISASNTQCTLSHTSLLIRNATWSSEHNITVTAVDDPDDGNQTCMVRLGATQSSDNNYNALDPDDVNVTVVSDNKPTSANMEVNMSEDETKNFASSEFSFYDADGDSFKAIVITVLPTAGSLALNSAPLSVNQVMLASDIGKLSYTPRTNEWGNNYTHFDFSVQASDDENSSTYRATINVARVVDNTPDPFSFTPKINQELRIMSDSNSVTLRNMDNGVAISIVDGNYSINGGAWRNSAGVVNNEDNVSVQVLTANSYSTTTSTTLTVGTQSATFYATTKPAPNTSSSSSVAPPSLFGYLWFDEDQDDAKGEMEHNILNSDITLSLIKGSQVIQRVVLSEEGSYLFENIDAGEYRLYIASQRAFSIEDELNVTSYSLSVNISSDSVLNVPLDAYESEENNTTENNASASASSQTLENNLSNLQSSSAVAEQSSSLSSSSSLESSSVQSSSLSSSSSLESSSVQNLSSSSSSESSSASSSVSAPKGVISFSIQEKFIQWKVDWYHENSEALLIKFRHQVDIFKRTRARNARNFDTLTCSVEGEIDERLCWVNAENEIVLEGSVAPNTIFSVGLRTPIDANTARVELVAIGWHDENSDSYLDNSDENVLLSNNRYSEAVEPTVSVLAKPEVVVPWGTTLTKLWLAFGFLMMALFFLRGVQKTMK